ncbi:MAG: DUF3551 domain-containing protein [Pseudomonadota bacterium]
MRTILLLSAIAAGTLIGASESRAWDGDAPFCSVVNMGAGNVVERCYFYSFEACRRDITGMTSGFCNYNPRFNWAQQPPEKRKRKYRRRS